MADEQVLSELKRSLSFRTSIDQAKDLFDPLELRNLRIALDCELPSPLVDRKDPTLWCIKTIFRVMNSMPASPDMFNHRQFTSKFDAEEFSAGMHRTILDFCLNTGLFLVADHAGSDQLYCIDEEIHTAIGEMLENQSESIQ
jgi:hypothetical protein